MRSSKNADVRLKPFLPDYISNLSHSLKIMEKKQNPADLSEQEKEVLLELIYVRKK